ncbi:MAG TPA: hypothetical protein VLH59_11165 [Ignavibacteriaceae bacterium]|nr:hypothetical protein [Ignavibacteriaceae bacterium]
MKSDKNFFVSILGIFIVLLTVNQLNAQPEGFKLYGIETGIIEYKYSGNEVGVGTLYFDKFGNRCAMKMDTKRDGELNRGWVISLEEYQYIYDKSRSNEGWKLKNPIIEWIQLNSLKEIEKYTEDIYAKLGIVRAGTEKFLGKECLAYKGENGKLLTWNGILMYLNLNFGGELTQQEVTSIKVNIPVDEKYFEIPKDVKFSDLPMFGTEGYDEEEEDSGDEDEE